MWRQILLLFVICIAALPLHAQAIKNEQQKPKFSIKRITPTTGFHPTCNLDSNSVGFYFFPPNLGAKWTLRTISQVFDAESKLLKSDTSYSFERIVSDSNRTLQGMPVIRCESSFPYLLGEDSTVKVKESEYYIDDSVVMTVVNHTLLGGLNHFMLLNPLREGASWKDVRDDTTRTYVIATHEPVSVAYGDFSNSLVLKTPAEFGEMSKYFVRGVGLVKIVFRGVPPSERGTFVVTTELIALDRGDPIRSIKYRFPQTPKKKHKKKKSTSNISK